jgi:hypothetical protein
MYPLWRIIKNKKLDKHNIMTIHWNYLHSLEQDIIRLSNYIEFAEENFNTYSIELLKLNLAIGSEIDVVLKLLCKSYYPERNFETIKDYKIFINENLPEIISESIAIPRYDLEFKPMEEIGIFEEGKYNSPFWWENYNSMKHRRDSEYSKANLKNLVYSFGALILINLYLILKIKNINDLRDLFNHVESLSLYDLGDKYRIEILGI